MSRSFAALFLLSVLALAFNALLGGAIDGAALAVCLLFSLLAAGALLAVISSRARSRLLATCIASLVGLMAIESYEWGFGLFGRPNYPESYDYRTKFEVVLDMRDQGIEAYPTIHPAAYIAPRKIAGVVTMPFGGVANATTVYCKENETGEFLVFESDEQGFNNPPGIWQRDLVDVALIGDSFTQGACVLKGNFAEHLRNHFDGVLNLGSGNSGPLIELATIKEYLAEFRPRSVIWFYYEGNDLFNLENERQSALLMRYLASDYRQQIRARQAEIDAQVRSFVNRSIDELRASRSRGVVDEEPTGPLEFLRMATFQRHLRHLTPAPKQAPAGDLRLFGRVLGKAKATVETWGGRLYFVYLPSYEFIRRGEVEPRREAVLAAARSEDIPIIDIDAMFRARADPLELFPFLRDGVHYTQEANRLIAQDVISAIESRPH